MNRKRQSIAFDFEIARLTSYYSATNPNYAYEILGRELHKAGFEHVQGSVYHSKNVMSKRMAARAFYNICASYPWIPICMKSCYITEINSPEDLLDMTNKISIKDTGKTFEERFNKRKDRNIDRER